jgi:hypothetical protein
MRQHQNTAHQQLTIITVNTPLFMSSLLTTISPASLLLPRISFLRRRFGRTFGVLKVAALSFLCAPLCLPTLRANDSNEAKALEASKSSVVLVQTGDAKNATPQGNGFYIAKNLVATSYHVVKGANKITLKNLGGNAENTKVRVKSYSVKFDVAILETEIENKTFLPLIASLPDGNEGRTIFTLRGEMYSTETKNIRQLSNGYNLIEISWRDSDKSSGSPLLNGKGQVLGINTFTLQDKVTEGIGIVVTSDVIIELKNKTGKWEPKMSDKATFAKREKKNEDITMVHYIKSEGDDFERFSLRNNTDQIIQNIKGIMIYRDTKGEILSYRFVFVPDVIPPKLVRMKEQESFEGSTQFDTRFENDTTIKPEFCILDYEVADGLSVLRENALPTR